MDAVKSLYTLALESVPAYPSPSEFANNYLPQCHSLFEPLYNLYYEEERQIYCSEHEAKMKYVETNTSFFNKNITPINFFCRHCLTSLLTRKPCPLSKWLWLYTEPCAYCMRITQERLTIDGKIAHNSGQHVNHASERHIVRRLYPRRWVRRQDCTTIALKVAIAIHRTMCILYENYKKSRI